MLGIGDAIGDFDDHVVTLHKSAALAFNSSVCTEGTFEDITSLTSDSLL